MFELFVTYSRANKDLNLSSSDNCMFDSDVDFLEVVLLQQQLRSIKIDLKDNLNIVSSRISARSIYVMDLNVAFQQLRYIRVITLLHLNKGYFVAVTQDLHQNCNHLP